MQIRLTLIVDRELTEQEAFERFQTVDPHEVAQAMQRQADAHLAAELRREPSVTQAGVKAEPIPWTVRSRVKIDGRDYLEGPDGHWYQESS